MANICLIHPFDPAGQQVGGINTYIRDFCRVAGATHRVLLIGIDTTGRARLGKIQRVAIAGTAILFIPIIRVRPQDADRAAKRLAASLTLRFAVRLGLALPGLGALLRKHAYTIDLRRVDFAFFPVLTRLPYVQMIHGVGVPLPGSGSLLARYPFVQRLNELLVSKTARFIFAVDENKYRSLRSTYPRQNVGLVYTWADPSVFKATAFPPTDTIRIIYAGRLEEVKNPELMFRVIHKLHRLDQRIRFTYLGSDDPETVRGFQGISAITTVVGPTNAQGVAEALSNSHLTLLCSHFEGFPRMVIEALACGRPAVVSPLPQLRKVIRNGMNGYIVEKLSVDSFVSSSRAIISALETGLTSPSAISATVAEFTPCVQLASVFDAHKKLQAGALASA